MHDAVRDAADEGGSVDGGWKRPHTTQQRDHIPVAATTGRREVLHKQVDHAGQLKDEERDAHKTVELDGRPARRFGEAVVPWLMRLATPRVLWKRPTQRARSWPRRKA